MPRPARPRCGRGVALLHSQYIRSIYATTAGRYTVHMNRSTFYAFLFFAALLVVITVGVGVRVDSPDGQHYFFAADNLLAGEGFSTAPGLGPLYRGAMTRFPPLYPALLAAMHAIGIPLITAATALNLMGGLLVLWVFARWVNHPALLVAAALFLVSPAFLKVYPHALTEPLFLGLVALFLYYAAAYWQHPNPRSLRWMIALAALAPLLRYIGVTVIGTGFLVIVARRRYKEALAFGVLASVPLLVWLARNYAVSGTLAGPRDPSPYPLAANLEAVALGLLVMAAPAALAIVALWHRIRRGPFPQAVVPPLLFAGVYLAFLVAMSTLVAYDPINQRLLAPVLPVAALLTAYLLHPATPSLRT